MSSMSDFNRDFYAYVPSYMRNMLENKLLLFRNEPWFEKAWNEFAQIASTRKQRDIPNPDTFFEKYLTEAKHNLDIVEYQAMESDEDSLRMTETDMESLDESEDGIFIETDFKSFMERSSK